jgi:hypothetical protein
MNAYGKDGRDLTLTDVVTDARKLSDIPNDELQAQLNVLVANKFWSGRYFVVYGEIQRRATIAWRKEDIFGQHA